MNLTPLLKNKLIKNIEVIENTYVLVTCDNSIEKYEKYEKNTVDFFEYLNREIKNVGKQKITYILSCRKIFNLNDVNDHQTMLFDLLFRNHYNVYACDVARQFKAYDNFQKNNFSELVNILDCFEKLFRNIDEHTFSTEFIEKIIHLTNIEKYTGYKTYQCEFLFFVSSLLTAEKKKTIKISFENLKSTFKSFLFSNKYHDEQKRFWKILVENINDLNRELLFIEDIIKMLMVFHYLSCFKKEAGKIFIIHGEEGFISNVRKILNNNMCKTREKKMFRHMDF